MKTRVLFAAGALVVAAALGTFLAAGTAAAQERPEPPPCPPGETCVEPVPPCPIEGPCGDFDSDDDGWDDFTEQEWGSDPNDSASTPEHGYVPETCADAIDNDGDGAVDMADSGCTIDSDGDGRADPIDNCPWDPNPGQADRDGDGVGDLCDYDADNDGWDDFSEQEWGSNPDDASSTPEYAYFPETCSDAIDNDADGAVDMADSGCTIDSDSDGRPDLDDNCPWDPNANQRDSDGDGIGDVCDYDADNDGWDDETERLSGSDPNDAASTPEHSFIRETCEDGADNDLDGLTDDADPGCAPDGDYDFVPDSSDNCPTVWNQDQADSDADGLGDACEDSDGDGYFDADESALGSDPADAASTPEHGAYYETCSDGLDNDRDGTTDADDDGCQIVILEESAPGADRDERGPPSASHTTRDQTRPVALPAAGAGPAEDDGPSGTWAIAGITALALGAGLFYGGARLRRRGVTNR